ncbi:MAG: hypothetical protein MZW92_16370 [Comamonadaceae bacterium]|nr:hypothetical protein [Comamonadaceae bacterium]
MKPGFAVLLAVMWRFSLLPAEAVQEPPWPSSTRQIAAHAGQDRGLRAGHGERGAAGARLAGRPRAALDRGPVLHLEHRQHRHPRRRGAAARGGARRAGCG